MPLRMIKKDRDEQARQQQAKRQSGIAQKQETPKPQNLNSKGSEKAKEPTSPSARRDERKAEQREERIKLKEYGMLTGGQAKLDKNKNNKIDAEDFKILRKEKSPKMMKAKKGKLVTLKKYPTKAKSILTTANVLDFRGRTSYLDLRRDIQTNQYGTKNEAIVAIFNWLGTVENSVQNRDLSTKLLNYVDTTFDGQYDIVNETLRTLDSRLSGELKKPNSGYWSDFTGQLNADGTKIKNDLLLEASNEFFDWTETEEGSKSTELEKRRKGLEILETYINKARESIPTFEITSGVGNTGEAEENESERQEQDMSNIQGDANSNVEGGAFTPSTPEDIARERKLDQTEKLDEILKGIDKTKKIPQNKINEMLLGVGFKPEEARIMAAIAMAESAGDPMIDTVKSGLDPEKKNEFSIGLFQLNMIDAFLEERLKLFGIESTDELYDPTVNVIAAKRLFDQQGFGAWSAYNNDSYKKFLTD